MSALEATNATEATKAAESTSSQTLAEPSEQSTGRRIEIYDTTLRDGTQGEGIAFSLVDKLNITQRLDQLGVDYIEGGFPGSNEKDAAYFKAVSDLKLENAKICAFGMTRRRGVAAADDPGMNALVNSGAPVITIVGKTWDLHVDEVLRVSREENLAMIEDSLAYCRDQGAEVFYDAEHFFDGLRSNPEYAIETLQAAVRGGATRLILCDTNGGSLPEWIIEATKQVIAALGLDQPTVEAPFPSPSIGIHTHNDGGVAVANTLAGIEAGAVQVQGTINGIGERCGNADLTTVAANLRLKMGLDCLVDSSLDALTKTSRYIYELANMIPSTNQPFVGLSAFAHKGGMHVHAVQRIAHSYEHVKPESVGNVRRVLVSELSGASNISATLGEKFGITDDKDMQRKVLERVQEREHKGYVYEMATASYELLLHEVMGTQLKLWNLDHYRCAIVKTGDQQAVTEAIVKMTVNGASEHRVAEGDGPVNALDGALRKCLTDHFPQLTAVHLRDYRVRVVNPTAESAAKVRVIAEFEVVEKGEGEKSPTPIRFATIGVNENIVDASWEAISDAFLYRLIETGVPADQSDFVD